MKKHNLLFDWTLSKKMSPSKRMVNARMYLKYPDWRKLIKYEIPERKKVRSNFLKVNLKKLLAKKYFDSYELIGTKIRPGGVITKLPLASLSKLIHTSFVSGIRIEKLQGAKMKTEKKEPKYFCVKVTVAIQIEGYTSGIQTWEEKYVLINAKSREDAFKKISRDEKKYSEPYLNTDGRLVRWKLESFDDCYEPYIMNVNELNSQEGIEVFSVMRGRKLTKERAWFGRLK